MKASSISRWLIATFRSPLASAASVPGVICRCSDGELARSRIARGSTTMSLPPRRRCASKYCISGGIVSAGLPPTSRIASAPGISLKRERQAAIDPERAQARRGGGGHAEAAVVVDVGGPQRDARELAEHVGLLVGEAAAAEHADRVGARGGLDRAQAGDDAVERLVPAHREQGAALVLAHQRLGQPVARVEQFGGGEALAAQAAFVGGEIARASPPGDHAPPPGSCRIAERSKGSGCRLRGAMVSVMSL